jgi:hypothetical protein
MGRFVLDHAEWRSGVARPAKPKAILDGTSCVEFRRARIDVAESRAGERRAPSILESHRSLLARPMSPRGEAGTQDILGAWQDQVPRTDNLAFSMTNSPAWAAKRHAYPHSSGAMVHRHSATEPATDVMAAAQLRKRSSAADPIAGGVEPKRQQKPPADDPGVLARLDPIFELAQIEPFYGCRASLGRLHHSQFGRHSCPPGQRVQVNKRASCVVEWILPVEF